MTDGHTKKGAWIVKLELTEDQVQQLIRSMEWALQVGEDEPGLPPRLDYVAHQAFLQDILNKLYQAVLEQSKEQQSKLKEVNESQET